MAAHDEINAFRDARRRRRCRRGCAFWCEVQLRSCRDVSPTNAWPSPSTLKWAPLAPAGVGAQEDADSVALAKCCSTAGSDRAQLCKVVDRYCDGK